MKIRSAHGADEVLATGAGATPPPMIQTEDLRFSYPDGTAVLAGITEQVGTGATVGVVGPSGCGKSTLLSAIAGLIEPTSGSMVRNTAGSSRHPLSMLFQKETLLPWLTVAENVALFSRFKRHGGRSGSLRRLVPGLRPKVAPEIAELVAELLTLVHLEELADRYPYQLSGGQRRRLGFLAAVAPKPQILLLDEPFSALDEPTRIGIHQDVFHATRMLGITTVLVTHDLAEALSLCDRVLILSRRPAVVAYEHEVPFGAERSMVDLRHTDEFLALYGRLWQDLSTQMGR